MSGEQTADLVIVTGMSGAGRSTAAKELEDLGYFVVDNLPPQLLAETVELVEKAHGPRQKVAVVIDVRSGSFFEGLREIIAEDRLHRRTSLLFLDAADDVLVRRQEAARRPHPLQRSGRLLDGVVREREALEQIRGDANLIIDTTELGVRGLTERIAHHFGTEETTAIQIAVVSFGFKYGIPIDADFVADMRFLPNPYWVPELRPLNGTDVAVAEFVLNQDGAADFLDNYLTLVSSVIPGYLREGKRFMTVAIGCTGGKHRSVATAEEVARRLGAMGHDATAQHRDLGRE
jgi:UPF0042 nucleotide-binding protein